MVQIAHPYDYASTYRHALQVNWQIDEIIGGEKRLDFRTPFLPDAWVDATLAVIRHRSLSVPAPRARRSGEALARACGASGRAAGRQAKEGTMASSEVVQVTATTSSHTMPRRLSRAAWGLLLWGWAVLLLCIPVLAATRPATTIFESGQVRPEDVQ